MTPQQFYDKYFNEKTMGPRIANYVWCDLDDDIYEMFKKDFLEMIKDCYTPAPDYINAEIEKIKIKE